MASKPGALRPSTPASNAQEAVVRLQGGVGGAGSERAFRAVLLFSTILAVVVLAVLLVDILIDGIGRLDWQFLTSFPSRRPDDTGILSALTGTLSLMVLVAISAIPIGVGAAIYLEEFAPNNRFTRLMEVNISNLAGVPSVVYGLLAAALFVYIFELGRSLISGALALMLLILPVVIVAARESIRAVPFAVREAGLGLGATRWQVVSREVLPAALPGIMTGTILALSRAIGETAPILLVGAFTSTRFTSQPWDLFAAFSALPVQIFDFVRRPQDGFRVDAASAAIIVLMVALLAMNSVAILLRNRSQRRV